MGLSSVVRPVLCSGVMIRLEHRREYGVFFGNGHRLSVNDNAHELPLARCRVQVAGCKRWHPIAQLFQAILILKLLKRLKIIGECLETAAAPCNLPLATFKIFQSLVRFFLSNKGFYRPIGRYRLFGF